MDLEECCRALESPKVSERSKGLKNILNLLQNTDIVARVNKGLTCSWDSIVFATYVALLKDAEKYVDDTEKKQRSTISLENNENVFFNVIKIIIKEAVNLNYSKILSYVKIFFEKKIMKKCYISTSLRTLRDYILQDETFRSKLESQDWIDFFSMLKSQFETGEILIEKNYSQIQCLNLMVKWGPLYGLPPYVLRESFQFFNKLCSSLSKTTVRSHQELIIEITFTFLLHTSKDNRMACCKLSEDVMGYLIEIYDENARGDSVKSQLIDFLNLIVTIHHPDGVKEGDLGAYAYNWNSWNKYVCAIYRCICGDIDFALKSRARSTLFVSSNDHQILMNNFVRLFVNVSRQIFNKTFIVENESKRPKIDLSISSLIDNIVETKKWPWIQLVYSVLQNYPLMINTRDLINLLETLARLQKEFDDQNSRHHLYTCLIVLEDVENILEISTSDLERIEKIWKGIAESTIKAIGINLCSPKTYILLQKLMLRKKLIDLQSLLDLFISNHNLTLEVVKTLHVFCQNYNFSESDSFSLKSKIMETLLSVKNIHFLSENVVSKVLICLTLKQYPCDYIRENVNYSVGNNFSDISEVYLKSSFEKLLISKGSPVKKESNEKFHHNSSSELHVKFMNLFDQFISVCLDPDGNNVDLNGVVYLISFSKNILSNLLKFNKITMEDVEDDDFIINKVFIRLFGIFETKLPDVEEIIVNEQNLKKSIHLYELFSNILIDDTELVLKQMTRHISVDLLKKFFESFNAFKTHKRPLQNDQKIDFRLASIKILSLYCFAKIDLTIQLTQKHVFEILVDPSYDVDQAGEYLLLKTFLSTFKDCEPGYLNEHLIMLLIDLIRIICESRYYFYESAVDVIDILKHLLLHIEVAASEESIRYVVSFLTPFYKRRLNYGPQVSVLLIRCFEILCRLDDSFGLSKWIDGEEIAYSICSFLCCDFQEVRFAAIESLVNLFEIDRNSITRQKFDVSSQIFKKIAETSLRVFEIEGAVNEERNVDETVTRTATVLHLFGSLSVHSPLWIQEALFAVLRISYLKNLIGLDKMISLIANEMKAKDHISFMEDNLEFILNKWALFDYPLQDFPFHLYNCVNKVDFCLKYASQVVPFIIERDKEVLTEISNITGQTIAEIIERSCSKIMINCICTDGTGDLESILTRNQTLQYVTQMVTLKKFKETLFANLEDLLTHLFTSLLDERNFRLDFDMSVIFPRLFSFSESLTLPQLDHTLTFITENVCDLENIFLHMIENKPNVLHKLLVNIKLTISKSNVDKIRLFYCYFILCKKIMSELRSDHSFHEYFVRDLVFYTLNLLSDPNDDSLFKLVVCKFFYIIIKKTIPDLSNSVSKLFFIIVNRLKNLALKNESLSDHCIKILSLLIIENKEKFSTCIETLDPFPSEEKFEDLDAEYKSIRYKDQKVTLLKEINYFLECGHLTKHTDTRKEGLKHLHTQLSIRKLELKELYLTLESLRGFSEDCESSTLHQLICMLIELTSSKEVDVKIEAAKCLGELGPANLSTLILRPEKSIPFDKWSVFELLTGHIIPILSDYLVDADINTVMVSSEALRHVLNSSEGRKIVDCCKDNTDFGKINQNYLKPFIIGAKPKSNSILTVNEEIFVTKVNDEELWAPRNETSHNAWITNLVSALLETFNHHCFLPKLIDICKLKPEFCQTLLPFLSSLIITSNKRLQGKLIWVNMRYFFAEHWRLSVDNDNEGGNNNSIPLQKESIRCLLNCVNFLYLQKHHLESHHRETINFDIDYLHLAQAAQYCSAHFKAILYTELWSYAKFEELENAGSAKNSSAYTMLNCIYESLDFRTRRALENILRTSYKALGKYDALEGCRTSYFLNPSMRMERYKEMGRWQQVLLQSEIAISNNDSLLSKNLYDGLKQSGFYELPILCQNNRNNQNNEHIQFDCLWRLGKWDTDESNSCLPSSDLFECYRFSALKSLHMNDEHKCKNVLTTARLFEIDKLKNLTLESSKNLYGVLAELQSLEEIENFLKSGRDFDSLKKLLEIWKCQDEFIRNEFDYIEPIKSERICMLNNLDNNPENSSFLHDSILDLSENARIEGRFNIAARALGSMFYIDNLPEDTKARVQLEDAQLCWSSNDKLSAREISQSLCDNVSIHPRIRAAALKLTGKWLIKSLSENRQTIISDYLLKSVKELSELDLNTNDINHTIDVFDQIGRFTDKEYQQISEYVKSELFQQKISNMRKLKRAASDIKGSKKKNECSNEELKAIRIHEQQCQIDANEIETIESQKTFFLNFALKYYLKNLIHSEVNNVRIFRIISLFFENKNNSEVTKTIVDLLPKLPSYKYIPMLPQLIPHLSNNSEDLFSRLVNEIVLKCAKEHPHHTLPLLLALENSYKDRKYSDSKTTTINNDSRIKAATAIINKLKQNHLFTEIISKMEYMSEAIMELAYYKPVTDTDLNKSYNIPRTKKIRSIKNYDEILLPTHTLEVSKDCKYDDIVGIHSFSDSFKFVGGINAPKQIICRGTDGKTRTQLVKGQDDLRQDAVMQQVFNIINNLLRANKQTKNLMIRTYKITPLSMRSGILEWCIPSTPIGIYLVGDRRKKIVGAHVKYRPMDKTPEDCRNKFRSIAQLKTIEEKLEKYRSICNSMKPVFHKFFHEFFPHASVWYERKLAYIHSVATSSMCGYILGIGDRHVQNILVDTNTAEVIHIDFGIAFEQGRTLPTPEMVPFRLTRDLIDGMGVAGIEGIFRKTCEKTMEVMRENSQTIESILEVLLYDPLYVWTVTSAEASKRQTDDLDSESSNLENTDSNDDSVNTAAERALLRLKSKLQGTEDGTPKSIEHQVGTLIQQARDPENLCRMYVGWQPYL